MQLQPQVGKCTTIRSCTCTRTFSDGVSSTTHQPGGHCAQDEAAIKPPSSYEETDTSSSSDWKGSGSEAGVPGHGVKRICPGYTNTGSTGRKTRGKQYRIGTYKCLHCDRILKNSKQYQPSRTKHSSKAEVKCKDCEKPFWTAWHLAHHKLHVHG